MTIGLLSDTHRRSEYAKIAIAHLLDSGAEFLVHAGDIGEKTTLDLLERSGQRYVAVYGNNDASLTQYHRNYTLVQEPYRFTLAKTTFKLMHLPFYLTPETDVVIFGHTHAFECDYRGNTLYLNPGETCARNKDLSECALLSLSKEHYDVTYYSRLTAQPRFDAQHFRFERR